MAQRPDETGPFGDQRQEEEDDDFQDAQEGDEFPLPDIPGTDTPVRFTSTEGYDSTFGVPRPKLEEGEKT